MTEKFEAELLPTCLAMGITYEYFWELNPRKLTPIAEGYKLRKKALDEQQWLLGGYIFEAVSLAMGNAFRKKGSKAKSYFDELKKPLFSDIDKRDENNMTEEEKKKRTETLFTNLEIMAANFNMKSKK